MKKKFLVISVVAIVIVLITTVSILSSANDDISNYKQLLSEMISNKTFSKEDRAEMKSLFDMPQLFNNSSNVADENNELDGNIDSYNIIVKFIIQLIKSNPERERICLGVDGYSKEDIVLWDAADDGDVLDITEEVSQALSDIKQSFSKEGYNFDAIRIEDGTILFDTIDGQYALIYKINKNADLNKKYAKEDSTVIIKSNKANWYHKIMS